MAKWNKIVITNAGYQLSAATLAGNTIRYTRAQTTDKDMSGLTSEQLKEITKLESVVQDLPLGTVSVQDDHTVNVPIKVMNSDLQEDYLLYGIAIFAKIEGGEEILYGIATSVNPDLIPAQNGSTVVGTTFKVKLHVGDAANVTIVVSPDGSVSNEELESILNNYVLTSDLSKLIAEKIPDTLADTTKAETVTNNWNYKKKPTYQGESGETENFLTSSDWQTGENLFADSLAVNGWVNSDGSINAGDDSDNLLSPYIQIPSGPAKLTIQQFNSVDTDNITLGFYDNDKKFISFNFGKSLTWWTDGTYASSTIVMPTNAKYFLIGFHNQKGLQVKVEFGGAPTRWTPALDDVAIKSDSDANTDSKINDLNTSLTNKVDGLNTDLTSKINDLNSSVSTKANDNSVIHRDASTGKASDKTDWNEGDLTVESKWVATQPYVDDKVQTLQSSVNTKAEDDWVVHRNPNTGNVSDALNLSSSSINLTVDGYPAALMVHVTADQFNSLSDDQLNSEHVAWAVEES